MDNPLITTIIPTYRRPQLLKRALSSALNQTYSQIQICVYDNASGDETETIVREFIEKDSRVKYHCHSQNLGMMGNYEYALKQVQTPYFSLLSDDDVIFPWFYEVALQQLQQFSEAALVACSTLIMNQMGKMIRIPLDLWSQEGCFSPPEGLREMISKYPVPTTILFRKKVIEVVPIDKENVLTWDCDFLLQIAARFPIVIHKRPCGIFLQHEASYSNAQDFQQWKQAFIHLCHRIKLITSLSSNVQNSAIQLINNDLKMTQRAFIQRSLFNKKFGEACDYAEDYRKNYGWNFVSFTLLVLSWFCRVIPLAIYPLYVIRKLKRMRNKAIQSDQNYAKWLKLNED